MARDLPPDEARLYAWARIAAAIVLVIGLALAFILLLILPAIVPGYMVSEGAVIGVAAAITTSVLALLDVTSVIRRSNGRGNGPD